MKTQKIKKDKIYWLIEDKRIVAFDKLQATSYDIFGFNYKKNLISMKKQVLKTELGRNWPEVLTLAVQNEMIGVSIRVREEWFEGF